MSQFILILKPKHTKSQFYFDKVYTHMSVLVVQFYSHI